MILPSMTYPEINETFRREIHSVGPKIQEAARKFGGMVKKSRSGSLRHVFDVSTKDKTILHLIFISKKKSDWDRPGLCIYSTFHHKDGLNAISINGTEGVAFIHNSHFFQRYKERIVEDEELGENDIIRRFMLNNQDLSWHKNTEDYSLAYKKYEKEEIPQLAARVEEGNCFIEKLGENLFLMKTIISDEMLKNNQRAAFSELDDKRLYFAEEAERKK